MLAELYGGPFDGLLLDIPSSTEVICMPAKRAQESSDKQRSWYLSKNASIPKPEPSRFLFETIASSFDQAWL